MIRKVILFLLLSSFFHQIQAQTYFDYPENLKTDTLYVPLFDYYPLTKKTPRTVIEKRDYDRVVKRNKKIEKANAMVEKIFASEYPFSYKTISLNKLQQKKEQVFVLESFSQLTRKMAYYYLENPDLLETLLEESDTSVPAFKDLYIYYYVNKTYSEEEYVVVDFGKKNINQALRYFCQSVSAYFNQNMN